MRTYRCGRCGAECQAMRVPDDWSPETVAAWRDIERHFVCDDCEALVVAYSDELLG